MERGLISVDRWSAGSQAYFLTHLHADHTQGLSSAWAHGPLFCSRLTAKLFRFKFPGFDLSLLRVLRVGVWHSLSLTSPSSSSPTLLRVFPIDAHHCPGSVMYLFRGEFGSLLYTGDFRWEATSEKVIRSRDSLVEALDGRRVDVLYLDNTFCNPSYSFPPRQIAAQQVVDIIASNPDHNVIIGIDTLGKEDLLVHISRQLKIKIWVWPERLQTMHLLGIDDIFTTKTSFTRVRAVPRYSFTMDTLEGLNNMHPTIGIMPSGLPWALKSLDRNENFYDSLVSSCCNGNGSKGISMDQGLQQIIYSVPYSDHSCYTEIQEFVKLVQPVNTRGIVSSLSCNIDPLFHFGHFLGVHETFHAQRIKKKQKERESTNEMAVPMKSHAQISGLLCLQKKCSNIGISAIHMNRASALRRRQCGVKIEANLCAD